MTSGRRGSLRVTKRMAWLRNVARPVLGSVPVTKCRSRRGRNVTCARRPPSRVTNRPSAGPKVTRSPSSAGVVTNGPRRGGQGSAIALEDRHNVTRAGSAEVGVTNGRSWRHNVTQGERAEPDVTKCRATDDTHAGTPTVLTSRRQHTPSPQSDRALSAAPAGHDRRTKTLHHQHHHADAAAVPTG